MVLELLKHGHPEADRKVRSCNTDCDLLCSTDTTLAVFRYELAVLSVLALYKEFCDRVALSLRIWP